MAPLTVVSLFIHMLVVYQVLVYFRGEHPCRESDKTIIAGLGVMSGLYVLSTGGMTLAGLVAAGHPALRGVDAALNSGFHVANAMVYYTIVRAHTMRREGNQCHIPKH
jgi:hypothetical protein